MGFSSRLAAMAAMMMGGPGGPKKPGQYIPGAPDRTAPPRGGRPGGRVLRYANDKHCDADPLGVQVAGEQALAVLDLALGLQPEPVEVGNGYVWRGALLDGLTARGVSQARLRKRRAALAKALRRGRRAQVLKRAKGVAVLCGVTELYYGEGGQPLTLPELAAPRRRREHVRATRLGTKSTAAPSAPAPSTPTAPAPAAPPIGEEAARG